MLTPRLKSILISAVVCIIIVSIWLSVDEQLESIRPYFNRLELGWILIVLAHTIAYRVINSGGWVYIIRALHSHIPLWRGINLWLASESCRWLPGSIWSTFSRMHLATKAGLPLSVASISVSLELVLTLLAWGATVVLGVIVSGAYHAVTPYLQQLQWVALVLGVLIAGAALSLWGVKKLSQGTGKVAQKLQQLREQIIQAKQKGVSVAGLSGVFVFYILCCVYNGYIFWLILNYLGIHTSISHAVMVNAVGWVAGFLAIAAPGGIGVREATLTILLLDSASAQALALSVVLWRLIQIASEILCLAPWGCQKLFTLLKARHHHAR